MKELFEATDWPKKVILSWEMEVLITSTEVTGVVNLRSGDSDL